MTEIGVGRYGDMLRRFLGMRGTDLTPGRDLLPDLNAAFVLENDRPEWAFLKGERRYVGSHSVTSAVAQFAEFLVLNPIDSGVISVVTAITAIGITGTLRAEMRVEGLARFTSAGNVRASDQRSDPGIATTLNGISVAPLDGLIIQRARGPVDVMVRFADVIMLLPPGTAFKIVDSTTNTNVFVNIVGYERPLEAYER